MRISIRAPLAGSDVEYVHAKTGVWPFQSALPLRGATCTRPIRARNTFQFQSALPLRGATQMAARKVKRTEISIRAPLAGSDVGRDMQPVQPSISIRAPLAGSDLLYRRTASLASLFQSALPLRGATPLISVSFPRWFYFNPRSPCGERPPYAHRRGIANSYFNPRSPCGERRLGKRLEAAVAVGISIRAPLAGSDAHERGVSRSAPLISIRAPLAGSDSAMASTEVVPLFQSALPLRGATEAGLFDRDEPIISIRAPLAGSDTGTLPASSQTSPFQSALPLRGATASRRRAPGTRPDFNPRSPCGERPGPPCAPRTAPPISIRAPLAGSDNTSVSTNV